MLVTGFEPFGEFTKNASQDLAQLLDGKTIEVRRKPHEEPQAILKGQDSSPEDRRPQGRLLATYRVVGHVLPVSFDRAAEAVDRLVSELRPAVVLMFGLSGRTPDLEIETLAKNIMHSSDFPDADGNAPDQEFIRTDSPAGHEATIPAAALVQALQSMKAPAQVSVDAGTYVCNTAFFTALDTAWNLALKTLTGFIHIPPAIEHLTKEQAEQIPHWKMADLSSIAVWIAQTLAATAASSSPRKPGP